MATSNNIVVILKAQFTNKQGIEALQTAGERLFDIINDEDTSYQLQAELAEVVSLMKIAASHIDLIVFPPENKRHACTPAEFSRN